MSTKAKIIAFMIFKIICFLGGLLFWFAGFTVFQDMRATDNWFGGWLFWGIFCMFAMALEFLKYVIAGARQGAAEGANSYSISDYGSYFTVHNNSLRDGIIGFLTSAFLYIAIGPIALAFKMLGNLRTVIQCIVALRRLNAGNE